MSARAEIEREIRYRLMKNPNLLVPFYLSLSYLYYKKGCSLVSDYFFDRLCKALELRLSVVEHRHKYLVDPEALAAGTGYHLEYPLMVQQAALQLRDDLREEFKNFDWFY